ncbi:pre-toxin TG domain-containing protein [Hyalangium rubrum]|uniref:Pre-toxin TG domain-containing protein n=1 Tax=Hyalangium rubrum TaxID=3103134 RepID=A0ABU5HDD1_9BACT|nr:pre-toxin TG domain-containing protein [Hyalangium sp. s54d21]MDY7231271.1 pre-toxin TG domain-containing protein [Hyalangium sp. s54d21]
MTWRLPWAVLGVALLLSGCASAPRPVSAWEGSGGGGGLPVVWGSAEPSALGRYMAFIVRKEGELRRPGLSVEERRRGFRVVAEMMVWQHGKDEAALSRTEPEVLYRQLEAAQAERDAEEEARIAAVEAKLEEFLEWGNRRWARSSVRFRKVGREYLLTEHPLRRQSEDALTAAVLDWAFTHTQDPDFPRKSPNEVAVYLLARRSELATAIELGQQARPHLDYTPRSEEPEATAEELVVEVLVGFIPAVGEAADIQGALVGYSVTGRKLSPGEQLLAAVAVLVPFVSGGVLSGAEEVGRAALLTGRGLEEVRVLQRVASHLSPQEAAEVERMLRAASKGEPLAEAEVEFLRRIARKLEQPLSEAAETLRQGGRVPFLGVRTGEGGGRLVPGEPAHMAQCWVDYQFRHPSRYPRFAYAPAEEWKRLYRTILQNKEAGTAFEQGVLSARGYEKNRALMMPPLESTVRGFIPDAVQGAPGELVWGRAYRFVEVKARGKLDLGGNLKAMLEYVKEYGGQVELWVRSARHPEGATRLSKPLQISLEELRSAGKAVILYHP